MTASSFSEIMKEEANKLAGKTKEEVPVLSTEDQVRQLEDRRKELRKKEDSPDLNITKEGVRRLLHDLNPSKACGPDGVTPRLLRTVADEICASVTLLFRASYKNGILPKD